MNQFAPRMPVAVSRRSGELPTAMVVQRKLQVGSTKDPAEAEADRAAELALRRMSSITESASDPQLIQVPSNTRIRRFGEVGAEGGPVEPAVASRINSSRGRGASLDGGTLQRMETGFGADFSDVRVHHDREADSLSQSLQAKAFTTGQDIYFRGGEYQPGSSGGDRLLAHELAHTIQQGAAPVRRQAAGNNVIRRTFSVADADWDKTTSVKQLGEGSANVVLLLKDKHNQAVVIKGITGAARTAVATTIMAETGQAPKGRTFLLESDQGKKLKKRLQKLAGNNKTIDDETTSAIAKFFDSSDSVLVMEAEANLVNMQKLTGSNQFGSVFETMKANHFFGGLGRIHAADMMVGNEDRLGRADIALKNVFADSESGAAKGLDVDMNAHSFDQVTGDVMDRSDRNARPTAENAPSLQGNEIHDFVNFTINGTTARKSYRKNDGSVAEGPMQGRRSLQDTAEMSRAADPATVGTVFDQLVAALIQELTRNGKDDDATSLGNTDWTAYRAEFVAAVAAELDKIHENMPKIDALVADQSKKKGADPFLNAIALKIRSKYVQMLKLHTHDDTMPLLEKYAQILVGGGTEAEFTQWYEQNTPPLKLQPAQGQPGGQGRARANGHGAQQLPVRNGPAQNQPVQVPQGGRARANGLGAQQLPARNGV